MSRLWKNTLQNVARRAQLADPARIRALHARDPKGPFRPREHRGARERLDVECSLLRLQLRVGLRELQKSLLSDTNTNKTDPRRFHIRSITLCYKSIPTYIV